MMEESSRTVAKRRRGGQPGNASWGELVEGSARELLAEAEADDDGEGGALEDARQFLASLLADGPVSAKAIRADADGAGYSWATIRRAQKALGVSAVKEGGRFGGGRQHWVWKLQNAEGAQEIQKAPNKKPWASSGHDEHLLRNQSGEPDIISGEL